MEAEARYAWVGVGVLALVALLIVGLWWLAGGGDEREMKRFIVYFQHQSLEGLQINSDVRMQGIKVGKVLDYAILPGQARKVRVLLQVDARTPVFEGATAVVTRHLVTGLAAIDLDNGPQGAIPLMRIPEGEPYPVIPEGVPQLARMANTLEELGLQSREALVRFNTLLSEANQANLAASLAHLRELSGALAATVPELRLTLTRVRSAADHLGTHGVAAAQAMREAGERATQAADATIATMADSRAALAVLDQEVRGLSLQLKLTADLTAQEIQATAQSLRHAGESLQDAGRALSDPARLIYGPASSALGPGEKR